MLVRDIMTRHVITISLDASLFEVREVFESAGFHHLVVVDGAAVVGVLSDRDLLTNISPFVGKMAERTQDVASLKRKVHQIMSRRPKTVTPDTPLDEAGKLMLTGHFSSLPVLEASGELAGIITVRDLAHAAVQLLENAKPTPMSDDPEISDAA